ncbi:MAG TPA: hypothetical protein VGE62_02855 [Candidatus Paceibacterota bacterium]
MRKGEQSGIVSLTLVILLAASLSSIVFGLVEQDVPYLRFAKKVSAVDKAYASARHCRDLAILHIYDNADFDTAFLKDFVAEQFRSVHVSFADESSHTCSVVEVRKMRQDTDGSTGYKIRSSSVLGEEGFEVLMQSDVLFDPYMKIISRKSVAVQE